MEYKVFFKIFEKFFLLVLLPILLNIENLKSAEEEIEEVKEWIDELFRYAQSKYENIITTIMGLASGALILSVSFLSNIIGKTSSWIIKVFLELSWVCFLVSILIGILRIYKSYSFYRKIGGCLNRITNDIKKRIKEQKTPISMISLEGKLKEDMRETLRQETPLLLSSKFIAIQFFSFFIGASLLLLVGSFVLFN